MASMKPPRTHRPAIVNGNDTLPDIEFEVEHITDEDYPEIDDASPTN